MSFDDDMPVIQRFMLQRLRNLIELLIGPATQTRGIEIETDVDINMWLSARLYGEATGSNRLARQGTGDAFRADHLPGGLGFDRNLSQTVAVDVFILQQSVTTPGTFHRLQPR